MSASGPPPASLVQLRVQDHASRRPLTPFMIFAGAAREYVLRSMPAATPPALLGRELFRRWAALTEAEKAAYQLRADVDSGYMRRRKREQSTPSSGAMSPSKRRKRKDPGRPKNPMTAYMYFSKTVRPKVKRNFPAATFGELGKLIGDRWRQIAVEGRIPFERLARKDKDRYLKQKARYLAQQVDGAKSPGAAAAASAGAAELDPADDPDVVEAEAAAEAAASEIARDLAAATAAKRAAEEEAATADGAADGAAAAVS